MFNQGYKYKVKFVKVVKENVVFQISKKKGDTYFNASVMTKADPISMSLQDGDEVILETIKGVSMSLYNGKTQVTLFCEIDKAESTDLGITNSDLPF